MTDPESASVLAADRLRAIRGSLSEYAYEYLNNIEGPKQIQTLESLVATLERVRGELRREHARALENCERSEYVAWVAGLLDEVAVPTRPSE